MATAHALTVPPVALDEAIVESFRASLRGRLLRPGDTDYDTARKVFNAMIDRHPALIAQCAGVADVIAAVNFAREHKHLVAARGRGHGLCRRHRRRGPEPGRNAGGNPSPLS